MAQPQIAGASSNKKKKAPPKEIETLRTLPISDRLFWKPSTEEQLSQRVWDQGHDYTKRLLPGNELTVMGLNEIAVARGRGFFYHLPSRESWKGMSKLAERMPQGRAPAAPMAQYPTMLYLDHRWLPGEVRSFLALSHRGRYLRASFIMHPPTGSQVHAMQYIDFQRCQLFSTPSNSLVVFATDHEFYVAQTSDLQRILGNAKRRRQDLKLATAPFLWDRSLLHGNDVLTEQDKALRNYRRSSLEDVYTTAVLFCSSNPPNYHAREVLQRHIPRPSSGTATAEGIPLGQSNTDSADPPNRRRGVQYRKRNRAA